MIKKILFIPRAIVDLRKVLLNSNLPFVKKWQIVKALSKIKLAGLSKKLNEQYSFKIGNFKVDCFYSKYNVFLVKEIFVDQIYNTKKNAEINSVLDLGSNIGLSVMYFKMQFPNVAINAFEPDKNSFVLLKKNVEQNNLQNVVLQEAAISSESGFLYAAETAGKASVNSQFVINGNEETNRVVSKNIEEVLKINFDVVKMDIEGGEWNLFRKIIDKNLIIKANHWFVEFHEIEKNRNSFEEIIKCFEKNGYGLEKRNDVIYFYKNI
jgi:FkbM family methyltransferase